MMILAAQDIRLRAITTVSGNVALPLVNNNVLRLLSYFNKKDIPVFPGAFRPLLEPPRDASGVHGSNGLGDIALPESSLSLEETAAPQGLYRTVTDHKPCSVLALGPLTNLACAFVLYPRLPEALEHLYIMGGALDKGNITRYAEFNIAADPEAAEIVFQSGVPITLLPWDVCLANIFTDRHLKELHLHASRAGDLFLKINQAPLGYFEKIMGSRSLAMADELAAGCCIDPVMITRSLKTNLHVELAGTLMRGATVTSAGGNITVVTEIDRSRFIDTLANINTLP